MVRLEMGGLGEKLRILPWTINAAPNLVLVGVDKLEGSTDVGIAVSGCKDGGGEAHQEQVWGEERLDPVWQKRRGVCESARQEYFPKEPQAVDQGRAGEIGLGNAEAGDGGW